MSKQAKKKPSGESMRPEYEFSGGQRGKHARDYQRGHVVKIQKTNGTTVVQNVKLEEGAVILAPDVREYFPDSEAVNQALRTLIALVPQKRLRKSRH